MENIDNSSKGWYRYLNKYVIVLAIFIIWMLFFDMNSVLVHKKLNEDLSEVNYKIDHYSDKFIKDSIQYFHLKNSREARETYAREHYFMKKKNEDIFIVVDKNDTIQ